MTTGSWDRGSYTTVNGGPVGLQHTRSWTGADSPPVPRPKRQKYITYREVDRENGRGRYLKKFVWNIPFEWSETDRANDIRRRRPPDNPYTVTTFKNKQAAMQMQSYLSNAWWAPLSTAMVGANTSNISLFTANDEIKLVAKLREKLQGSDFNMSVFLGEGHQTLKMIGDSAIRIAKAGYHAKRGDITGAARALFEGTNRKPVKGHGQFGLSSDRKYSNFKNDARNASSIWLELQYGWLPLLQDAEGAAHALAHHLTVPARKSYKVRRKLTSFAWGNAVQTDYRTFGYCRQRVNYIHERGVIARIQEKDLPTTLQKLGLMDPELVLWELLPFSFVADWFVPIGSYLEARATASRLKGTFVYMDKQRTVTDGENDVYYVPGPRGYLWRTAWPQPGMVYDRVQFSRTISTALKVPMPVLKPLSKVASWQHCANAIALLTQIFTKPGVDLSPKQRGMLTGRPAVLPEHYWSK